MTDTQVFPFAGEQTGTPSPVGPVEETSASSRGKVLLLGGALAVLAVLGVALYFLVFSGSGADPAPVPVPKTAVPAPSAPVAEAPAAVPADTKPQKLDPNFGDPFKPLIVAVPEGAAAVGTAGNTAPVQTGTTGTPAGSTNPQQGSGSTAPSTSGSGSTAGTPQQSGNSAPLPSKAYRVQVVKTAPGNSTITVKVNDKTYTKKAGQVFATYFKVIFIGGNENAFQFGDVRFSTKGQRAVMIAN